MASIPYKAAMGKVKHQEDDKENGTALRRGWTTGACATAAVKSSIAAFLGDEFIDPVTISLPKGDMPSFPLAMEEKGTDFARAGIIKDAGDDPDVTHGAMIIAQISQGLHGSGITFHAGEGVGTVTKPGLPIDVGEAAINPVPRKLMQGVVKAACKRSDIAPDIKITISVPGGEKIAERTWNPRLGIVGGISILGTTGIVHPFSCSAWIHSIHRGIDVARAVGLTHVLGATGSTSEHAACQRHDFPEIAMLDMGDFAGGLLKYLRQHPIPKLTLAGGIAKFTKLAQGAMDLHSGRSQVDFHWLAEQAIQLGMEHETIDRIQTANTAMEAFEITGDFRKPLANLVAIEARKRVMDILRGAPVDVEILVYSRDGSLLGEAPFEHPKP